MSLCITKGLSFVVDVELLYDPDSEEILALSLAHVREASQLYYVLDKVFDDAEHLFLLDVYLA